MSTSTKSTLHIFGSIATDYVSVIGSDFPQIDQNAAFLAPELYVKDGGTGSNIMHGLLELNRYAYARGDAMVCAVLYGAADARRADKEITRVALSPSCDSGAAIFTSKKHTAQAHIITDQAGNQLIAFHPGAMADSAQAIPRSVNAGDLVLVSPTDYATMLEAVKQCAQDGAKVFLDPGQQLGMFTQESLTSCLEMSYGLFVNKHELDGVIDTLGLTVTYDTPVQALQILSDKFPNLQLIIATQGADGQYLLARLGGDRLSFHCPAITLNAQQIVDPTGCGDAFRAGFLWSLLTRYTDVFHGPSHEEMRGMLQHCCFEGSRVAAECAKVSGPQEWTLTKIAETAAA